MTHQELDDLFRANSERGEFAPEPGEWEEMTALLDADERRDRYAWWVSIGWMSLFILLIAGGIYGLWMFQGTSDEDVKAPIASTSIVVEQQAEEVSNMTPAGTNPDDVLRSNATDALQAGSKEVEYAPATDNLSQVISSDAELNSTSNTNEAFAKTSLPPTTSGLESTSKGIYKSNEGTNTVEGVTTEQHVLAKAKRASKESNVVLIDDQEELPALTQANLLLAPDPNEALAQNTTQEVLFLRSVPMNELALLDFTSLPLAEKSPLVSLQKSNFSRFGVSLFVAEELTSVGMSNKMHSGTRVGAQFHYKPFDHWSVSLGIAYAHKKYRAPDGAMKNTLGLFVDDVLPSQTDGECRLLEIPLLVSYLPKGHGSAGPFVTGGLLSYRVFREEMEFSYDEPAPNQAPSIESNVATGSLFGTAQLQIGYRFLPQRGPAWRFGPYVQVPISTLGHGNLPIYSGGLQLEVELF